MPIFDNVLGKQMSSAEAILELTSWLEDHVQDLSFDGSNYPQLSHKHNTVLHHFSRTRET